MKLLTLLLSLTIFISTLNAGEKENVIKGVVLERISQFIDYNNTNNNFKICVYKNKTLASSFEKLYEERDYKGLSIKIEKINKIEDISNCNIFYASDLNNKTLKKIIAKDLKKTLLVGEKLDDVEKGFMIALYFEKKKLRFAINHSAIEEAGLSVNYRLLQVASKVVDPVKVKR